MIRKNFCAAPWAGLSVDPSGFAGVCSISSRKIPFVSIDDFKTNPRIIQLRQAVIDDQQHTNCSVCWAREENSSSTDISSRRSTYQYNDFYNNLNDPTAHQLEHLDLRWSNTCNLNCVYCSFVYSSKWAKLLNIKEPVRVSATLTPEHIKNLKYLQLAGGEPFLIKENLAVVQTCLTINPDVEIEVTTNLTSIKHNEIYYLLKEFPNVRFVVSFEAIEKRFEYIRNGAIWNEFRQNLDQLAQDFTDIDINMIYFPLSAYGISDAINIGQQYTKPENIYLVAQAGGHGFDMLGKNVVQCIKDINSSFANTLPGILKQRLQDQINLMASSREDTYLPDYHKFDQLTNQNHQLIFTELY